MFRLKSAEESREEMCQRDKDWTIAYNRLLVEFEADQGGGWPTCLNVKGMSPDERLQLLRSLGYRVLRKWWVNVAGPDEPERREDWVALPGKLCVNLDDGFVCRGT